MDYTEVKRLQDKNCEAQFQCATVMPGPDATDAERQAYFKDPCHEKRAACYKDDIEALNEVVLAPYNKKKEEISIGFGVGMTIGILLLIGGIIFLIRRIRKPKKATESTA